MVAGEEETLRALTVLALEEAIVLAQCLHRCCLYVPLPRPRRNCTDALGLLDTRGLLASFVRGMAKWGSESQIILQVKSINE